MRTDRLTGWGRTMVGAMLVNMLASLSQCATTGPANSAPDAFCRPTGWVDRLEGRFAILDLDGSEEEQAFPLACFETPVSPGTRLVQGRVDEDETARVRRSLDDLVRKLQGLPAAASGADKDAR